MKRYHNYRESGVKWVNEFPSTWELVKFKRFAKIRNGKDQKEVAIDEGGYPILGTGGEFGRSSQFIHEKPSVLLGRKGTINKPQYIDEPFWTVDTLFYTDIYDDVNPKYLFYLSQQIPFDLLQESSAVPSMTQEKLNGVYLCKPSLNEQIQIAKYLDYKTNIIDQLIKQKRKLIDSLIEKKESVINEAVTKGLDLNAKMKDSGIYSFGSIPKQWSVTKLKYLSNVKGRIGFRGYTTDDLVEEGKGALALGASHITWEGDIDLSNPVFISWPKYEESPEIKLNIGDIIIVQRGSTCGKVGIISSEIGPATINPSLVVLKEIKANPYYVFVSIKAALQELINLTRSAAIPMLSQEQIGNLQIVLPPIEEQRIISEFLQETKNHFKDLINKITESIAKLHEYRQSIISEAVTGKIDVRDWQANKQQVA